MCHILSSIMEYSEQVGFVSGGSSFIVDNSDNAHIFSEEYMFTDNIDPTISNVVSTIVVRDIIPNYIVMVS